MPPTAPQHRIPFVVGCQRSGTSLLTAVLDRHSQLAMMPETHLLGAMLRHRPGWQPGPSADHLLLCVWERAGERIRDLHLDPLAILDRLTVRSCSPSAAMEVLLELWAEKTGKPRAGEKTPDHLRWGDRILEDLPRAHLIIMVRDGRAVVQSMRRAPWWTDREVEAMVGRWAEDAELASRWLSDFPDRTSLLRYEDLVTDPEAELSRLLDTLGLEFEPAILEPSRTATFRRWEDSWKQEAGGRVSPDKVGAWIEGEVALPAGQRARLAPGLMRFGYPEPGTPRRAVPQATGTAPPVITRESLSPDSPPILVIGAQRAGSTSIARWIQQHPQVLRPRAKENRALVARWPLTRETYLDGLVDLSEDRPNANRVPLDATPYYLAHPDAARRARLLVPSARIVVILRDPVERAYSHWLHEWYLGTETLPFEAALTAEDWRLAGEVERLRKDETAASFAHVHYSYATRGRYAERLEAWYEHFESTQILVLMQPEVVSAPAVAWQALCRHVGLEALPAPAFPLEQSQRWPLSREKVIRSDVAIGLRRAFAADASRLAVMLGRAIPWSRTVS
jgi:hypothetical protein